MRRIAPYVLLALLCAILFIWRLGSVPLIGLDEGLYAECSREMLVSGDYVVPTCNGKLFLDKPPLGYWLQASSMRVFGVNSFGARFPSTAAAMLLVGFTVFLGSKLRDRRAGLMAGFVLATGMLTAGLARLAVMDQLFSLTIAVSLGAFLLSYLGIWTRLGYLLFWAAMGASVMIKGPAGMLLICGIVGVYLVLKRDVRGIMRATPVAGVLIFLAITVPWYALVQVRTHGTFAEEFFIHQNLQRAMGKDFQHNQPFWFYLPIFVVGFFPWSVFVPLAWSTQVKRPAHDSSGDASLFAAIWMIAVVALFSISRSKLPSYIFPMYPAAALLVGSMWSRSSESGKLGSLRRYSWGVFVVAVLLAVAFQVGPGFLPEPIPGLNRVLSAMGCSIVVGAGLALVLLAVGKGHSAFAALCGGMSAFVAVAALAGLPIASRSLSDDMVEMANLIEDKASKQEGVMSYRLSPPQPALGFYANRPVLSTRDPIVLRQAIRARRVSNVVIQNENLSALPPGGILAGRAGEYHLYKFPTLPADK
ncbi:MAG: ArnT family glycosyltransferase [Armatimonadota bacterium]